MSAKNSGDRDETDDPTGVRALLAGLGQPQPRCDDLVDRINRSLAQDGDVSRETSRSSSSTPSSPSPSSSGLSSRRVLMVVGSAAAVAVTLTVVITQVLGGNTTVDLTAAVAGEAAYDGPEGQEGMPALDSDNVAQLLPRWLDSSDAEALPTQQAGACSAALDEGVPSAASGSENAQNDRSGARQLFAVHWRGRPAAVLTMADQAWVVPHKCAQGDATEVLHGPVPLAS